MKRNDLIYMIATVSTYVEGLNIMKSETCIDILPLDIHCNFPNNILKIHLPIFFLLSLKFTSYFIINFQFMI